MLCFLQDSDALTRAQQAILQLQAEVEKLHHTTSDIIDENKERTQQIQVYLTTSLMLHKYLVNILFKLLLWQKLFDQGAYLNRSLIKHGCDLLYDQNSWAMDKHPCQVYYLLVFIISRPLNKFSWITNQWSPLSLY